MDHLIEFRTAFTADFEVPSRQRLERLRLPKWTRALVGLRPYVVETAGGPVEMADLYFPDGSVARGIRFAQFRFVN